MDHLVCADVGYGKTEVALRAAAAAVFAGQQVAVMAPTSVLARQHLDVFRRRFAGMHVTVEPLTGAMSKPEADRVRNGLADGSVDIVIGTHALLSKDVQFQRLGLMVVDEEQRFGAAQKQALKRRTKSVHSLALSATPIPRTLQGALAGLRGLSIIDTPPARRRPVRTAVTPRDSATARAALLRELGRGGQAFCVAPRIADLGELEDWIRELVPSARIAVAHGRLGAAALDDAVMGFVDGESDILLATPIIESGIDIPRANTLLLFRPDLFGLGQLHQLRGRVGRGAVQGCAYLLTDPDHPLEERATRRLGSLEVIESLGGGFVLSMLDLDQRGAGDLLGEDQSGHLRAVGTELYQRILADALRALRRQPDERWDPEVTVAVPQHPEALRRAPTVAASRLQIPASGNDRAARVAAVSAERLAAGCACVVGMVVWAAPEDLQALTDDARVRAVEALPGDAVAGRFAVSPLLPEQVEVVAPGPDDGEP